jgi:F0F1-type ATP synthase assembly protein I
LTNGAVGIELAAYLTLPFLGGQWLDGRLGTAPWLKWTGAIVGIGAAINALVRVVREYNQALKKDAHDDANKPD